MINPLGTRKRIYNPTIEIWDRQKWETMTAYKMFCIYRDAGPDRAFKKIFPTPQNKYSPQFTKSLKATPKLISKQTAHGYSTLYEWAYRCAEYDSYMEKKARKIHERKIIKMYERYAKAGEDMYFIATEKLKDQKRKVRKLKKEEGKLDGFMLSASEIARIVKEARENEMFGLRAEKAMPSVSEEALNSDIDTDDTDFTLSEKEKEETALLMTRILGKKNKDKEECLDSEDT